ncbi:MAG TPA: TIGR03960 family B12-binding radical SAM protein [Syntrophales bacterium]|nr:TIGR03960 family B12-binding radical SAM protein [Syntrophales bacterium]HOX95172.1 TIGR03960 family B12-binding radical SAM protein [Syntrophales bacterium]HPI58055.1 TIGR03960 family B12-binding radical SAM protein [Syntrophales bacterium]HPN25271.1 TIGR03960 family B12-binding radical SAM protein [Syntrophales bacterium]HQM29310.1 TIGR03960 family B12-binding radical SAM protein [Syntrophales bacterium]
MTSSSFEEILSLVEKPSRYIGGEVNTVRKDRAKCQLAFALAFPDAYEVGMSHLGLQILYAILNSDPNIVAERFYAPWPDMERRMRTAGLQLSSLESRTPLRNFDIVGFSLQYELSYTNVLNMLDLGGVPLRAGDRREGDPLIIAGGPCAFNPAPMAPFFDAVVIGEGEEVVVEIARAVREGKEKGGDRRKILTMLSELEGVYVPALRGSEARIRKRIVTDLDAWRIPLKPLVPLMNTIHDRATLEIARGCTRGCRFCQAGMVWRPVRERSPSVLRVMAEEMLCATGYDEISLLSLSTGDYSGIEYVLSDFMNRFYDRRVAVGLPSLRVETLSRKLIEEIRKVRKTSFTLAPEAGTQRLRDIINKGNTEEDLLQTARRVFEGGWKSVKLYFMIGIPGEREEDLEGIADLAYKVLREGKSQRLVNLALSTFVPKPHTPFQWHGQSDLEEILDKQRFFKKRITHRNLALKWHDGRMSHLEGIFSRGDERLAAVVERAYRFGCRFDGWSDAFRFDDWQKALAETGIRAEDYLRERGTGEPLPWARVDCGLSEDFLLKEYQKSREGSLTADCRTGECQSCGVCDFESVRIVEAKKPGDEVFEPPDKAQKKKGPAGVKWRLKFSKAGEARFLSHLEVASALIRAIRQTGLSLAYSEGFRPHPRLSFGHATAVGMESLEEHADLLVEEPLPGEPWKLRQRLNERLPSGLSVEDIREIRPGDGELLKNIKGFEYEIPLPETLTGNRTRELEGRIGEFLSKKECEVTRREKEGVRRKNIRPCVGRLVVDRQVHKIILLLLQTEEGTARPLEILTRVLGFEEEEAKRLRVIKKRTLFGDKIC